MRPRIGLFVIGMAMACSVGTRVQRFPPARDPGGATIRLRVHDWRGSWVLTAELLAVQDGGLLVRDSSAILFVSNQAVRQGEVVARGGSVSFAGKSTGGTRRRLRLLSRYPGGMSADVLNSLLSAYGRDSVQTVR